MPVLYAIPVLVAASLVGMRSWPQRQRARRLPVLLRVSALMLVGAAAAVYPNLLVSTTDPA